MGLYLLQHPKNTTEKETNKETLALAEQIRAKRQLALQAMDFGFMNPETTAVDFLSYFEEVSKKKQGKTQSNWLTVHKYLVMYSNGKCLMQDVTPSFCAGFVEYLMRIKHKRKPLITLNPNSIEHYFQKFKAGILSAVEERLIEKNPLKGIRIKKKETHREFLTEEELNKLASTECKPLVLKRMGLFSALTGMRYGDIKKLKWGDIRESKSSGYFIQFLQEKTKGAESLPISEQAFSLLGERGENEAFIFDKTPHKAEFTRLIQRWFKTAGIQRFNFTFHCFRHTFATSN